ncbi:50S ribosomal protein L7/L12 [Blattabacterium cuenoti]|uniref:50S ribosomal protein L7/L12 n=1 Tax=Blattabacterium cuenoti TaxID=1653831 RepID=UPI00163C0AB5|nr:50S ribosomal protein L7/L12 [Blattabacterium cuenoti]
MIKKLAEQLVNLTVKEVNELTLFLKEKYGIEPSNHILDSSKLFSINKNEKIDNKEEQKLFNLILKSSGNSKLSVVKLVKDITGKGLKESKELVDSVPTIIKESIEKKEAEDIKNKLENIGAEVELK